MIFMSYDLYKGRRLAETDCEYRQKIDTAAK